MTLYKADFLDLVSEPVKKTKGKKKVEAVEESEQGSVDVKEPEVVAEKVKKPRTEKQLAALEKMKETRKRKREEAEAEKVAEQEAIQNKQKEIENKEKEIAEKKALQAEKRRLKREEKKQEAQESTPSNTSAEVDEAVAEVLKEEAPKIKKQKVQKNETNVSEPPAWFQKYVEGVNKEQNLLNREKKPAKQVKIESQEVAAKSWNDGLTRDRVRQEVDGHMGRMYNMMFGARRIL